jgi:hypothetical protein
MINLTPHEIVVHAGGARIVYPPSGTVARVSVTATQAEPVDGVPCVVNAWGEVTGLVLDEHGIPVPCLVSALVLGALPHGTPNVFAPDTGSTAVRDTAGHLVAVTRLVRVPTLTAGR